MQSFRFLLPLAFLFALAAPSPAQLSQTFETGEDTTNWGTTSWSDGVIVATFLNEEFGGLNAGSGTSDSQSFSRSFRNNTAGVDVTQAYTMSMYVQLNTYDGPDGGVFEIVDGAYGSGNAGNLRVTTTETPGVFAWQARDNNLGWLDLDLVMELGNPYHIVLAVDPASNTYSATVQLTDTGGGVLETAALFNLAFDPNAIGNGQNGVLLFYIQASGDGGTEALVDNINITGVPEPSTALLLGITLSAHLFLRRRRNSFT